MASYYSIVKYSPNPLSEESINVGLITYSGGEFRLRLTEDWHRATYFGRKSPEALREAVRELYVLQDQNALTEQRVRRIYDTWQREVTLTAPRASTLAVDALMDRLTGQLLRFPALSAQVAGKRQVLGVAKTGVLGEIVKRYGVSKSRARTALRSGAPIEGRFKEHALDLAIFNGHFLGGAIGLSLAHPSRPQTERELDGAAFVINDIKGAAQATVRKRPLYVIGHTKGAEPGTIARASSLFDKVGGTFVPETRIAKWTKTFVEELPDGIFVNE